MNRSHSPRAPHRVKSKDREREALQMRKAGATYDKIGESLGLSRSGAYDLVRRGLDELNKTCREEAELLRRLEDERLNAVWEVLWPKMLDGDLRAIDRGLRLMERRSRLWGLDVQEVFGGDSEAPNRITFVRLGHGTTTTDVP